MSSKEAGEQEKSKRRASKDMKIDCDAQQKEKLGGIQRQLDTIEFVCEYNKFDWVGDQNWVPENCGGIRCAFYECTEAG